MLDRLIQQVVLQVLQPKWDPTFSVRSDRFRPGRSAHQAVAQAQRDLGEGSGWVVDLDLEKNFDWMNHDKLMSRLKKRVADRRVLPRIDCYLKAGALTEEGWEATREGTPQGGPVSPPVANLLLDELDKELARQGHRFVRDADDGNIFVKSAHAGQRVLARGPRFLERRLKLAVNAAKSVVDRPWRWTFLGFTFTGHRPHRRRVSGKAFEAYQHEVRRLTSRTRGVAVGRVVGELRLYLTGWYADVGFAEAPSRFKELDSWLRRRPHCYLWKQWGRRQYRELLRRGVSRDLAWNTVKSAHGPWRLSRSPALATALPGRSFDGLCLPRLHQCSHR